nr:Chain C, Substance P1-6, RPKPQQ [synthetic construct]3VI1_D Chain D, Substance P1-6, RPKPQQ [synthetic construct]
RPKPQQ